MALYDDSRGSSRKRRVKAGYGTAERARRTIKALRKEPVGIKKRIAQTMYFRAKYHANQTREMREAMKVYKRYLDSLH